MSEKQHIERIGFLHELHLNSHARHLAEHQLQESDDLYEIHPTSLKYFRERLEFYETATCVKRRSDSPPMLGPQTPSSPPDRNLMRLPCADENHLDRRCICKAGKTRLHSDGYLFITLRQPVYKRGFPGYAHFIKAKTLVENNCTIEAVIELFTPFIGILPRNVVNFVDFHHSTDRWKHHLNRVQVWPAHNIDARIPASCVLVTGLSCEEEDAPNDEMDRWLLWWMEEHHLKPDPLLEERYKAALFYDLAKPTERWQLALRIVRERDEKRNNLRGEHVARYGRTGELCPRLGNETSLSKSKPEPSRLRRKRKSMLRSCVSVGGRPTCPVIKT